MNWSEDWPIYTCGAAFVLVFGLMIWAMVTEAQEWQAFAASHNCHVTGRVRGDVFTTVAPVISSNGSAGVAVGIGSTPDKTGYLCDDGVTYWR